MIHLGDDVKTGGVRVSFVVTDNEECSGDCCGLCDAGETVGDLLVVPQTVEMLNLVGRLLNKARRQVETN